MNSRTIKPIFKKSWLWALLVIVAPVGVTNSFAQSLTRSNPGLRYTVSACNATIDSDGGWQYSASEAKWEKTVLLNLPDYDGLLTNFISMKIFKASNGKDTNYPVLAITYLHGYYEYPALQEDYRFSTVHDDYVLSGAGGNEETLLASLHSIDTAKAANFSPGVQSLKLSIFSQGPRVLDTSLLENVNRLFNTEHFGGTFTLLFFPVKTGDTREVRFLIQQYPGTGSLIDKNVFDDAYFTVDGKTFSKFISALF